MIVRAEKYEEATKAVKENDGYCPCLIERSNQTKCICKEFRDNYSNLKLGESVVCRCGRFRAVN